MNKNDNLIKDLLSKLEDQKAQLGAKPRGTWITHGIFKKNNNDYFNINVVTDFKEFASALGFLILQEEAFNKGCEKLGINKPLTMKWDGYSRADWEEDFKMRISIVEYENKKKLLDATKDKLNSLISADARTEIELENIKKLLS